ncbi:hypothetical protein [Alistipes sp.]|uniref:hypothetical protein n=1 Tax=Alistipes sp. TaxID=1872444 RepID=UPI003AF6C4E2
MKTNLNYNRRRVPVLLLVGLFAASCSKDPAADIPGGSPETPDKTITVTFDLTRDFEQSITVKADEPKDVTTISDLWIIQFSPDGLSKLQEPVYTTDIQPLSGGSKVELQVQAAPCKMLFVANTHNGQHGFPGVRNYTDAEDLLVSISSESDLLSANGVCMSGVWTGTADPESPGAVSLTRAICKVNFTLGADLPAGESYEVRSVQVRQIPRFYHYHRDEAKLTAYSYPSISETMDYPVQELENVKFAGGGILLIVSRLCGIYRKMQEA